MYGGKVTPCMGHDQTLVSTAAIQQPGHDTWGSLQPKRITQVTDPSTWLPKVAKRYSQAENRRFAASEASTLQNPPMPLTGHSPVPRTAPGP